MGHFPWLCWITRGQLDVSTSKTCDSTDVQMMSPAETGKIMTNLALLLRKTHVWSGFIHVKSQKMNSFHIYMPNETPLGNSPGFGWCLDQPGSPVKSNPWHPQNKKTHWKGKKIHSKSMKIRPFLPTSGLHLVPQGRHKQWRLVRRGGAIEVGTSGNLMGLDHLNGDMNGNFERDFMGFFGFFVGNYGDSWWFQWHGKFDGFNAHLIRF